jgi:hypothetical protein
MLSDIVQPESGLWRNTYVQEGHPVRGEGRIVFGEKRGELSNEAVRVICACVEMDPMVRPSARELVGWLTKLCVL